VNEAWVTSRVRKVVVVAAAIVVAVVVFLLLTLPPGPGSATGPLNGKQPETTVSGAYHVHSTVSDGAGDRDQIASAAARAGLKFVVFTDHGDGTRVPDPPRYAHGVLCIDGVEISTNGGHYVALDMRPASYPLGGEAVAVIEDVRRLGGFGIAAHPYSARGELGWSDWEALFDAVEWLNADSEWRDERAATLFRLPFDYLVRPESALASLLDRPAATMARWDALSSRRPVVGLAGHDAHGGISRSAEGGSRFRLPGLPSYESSFRAFSLRVMTGTPLSGSAAADARLVLNAIRRGRVFSAIDAIAAPARLDFGATAGAVAAQMGDALPFDPGVELVVRSTVPEGGSLVLICDGRDVAESTSGEIRHRPEGPMPCRPEVRAAQAPGEPPVPWIVGNAIHLLAAVTEPVGAEPVYETTLTLDHLDWTVEKDAGSQGSAAKQNGALTMKYELRSGARVSQYVAAAAPLAPPVPPYDRILFTAQSSAPMRMSIQLRFAGGERWLHSVYVEPDARRIVVPLSSMEFAERGAATRPDFRNAASILFVVDLTNAQPGATGAVRISDLSFGRELAR
jgi:hypothetical protein